MLREKGETHPPKPFDMDGVAGINVVVKHRILGLGRGQELWRLTQESNATGAVVDHFIGAQHPDTTYAFLLWDNTPHTHGPVVGTDHRHARNAMEEAIQQRLSWAIATAGCQFSDVLLPHGIGH